MSKSHHHKAENKFKFRNFADRISNVNIDVVRKNLKHTETPEDEDTFFYEGLQKWQELNCTQHFTNFQREIRDKVHTFAQLLHNKEIVVGLLEKHLQIHDSLALEPLLDLVVQLARDLQSDFYPLFPAFFRILVKLLSVYHHDTETLEKIFVCLSYIFKFLWRHLLKDIENVFTLFCPLLDESYKEYIRNFAAESFAFLMRKVKDRDALFDFMFKKLVENPKLIPGLGRLLFEMMKNVSRQFHSCHLQVLPCLLGKLRQTPDKSEDDCELIAEALVVTMGAITLHTSKEAVSTIWTVVQKHLTEVTAIYDKAKGKNISQVEHYLYCLLKVHHVIVEYRSGALVTDASATMQLFSAMLKAGTFKRQCLTQLLDGAASLLLNNSAGAQFEAISKLMQLVYSSSYDHSIIYSFSRKLFPMMHFEKDVLPKLLAFCQKCITTPESKLDTLMFITELLLFKSPLATDASQVNSYTNYLLDFGSAKTRKSKVGTVADYITGLLKEISLKDLVEPSMCSKIWAALVCLPHIRPVDSEACKKKVVTLFTMATDFTSEDWTADLLPLIGQLVITMASLMEGKEFLQALPFDTVKYILEHHPDDVSVLRSADFYFTIASLEGESKLLTPAIASELFPLLQNNISSCYQQNRLLTLRIFSHFEYDMPHSEDVPIATQNVFQICLSAELTIANIHTYRDKLKYLRKLEHGIVTNILPKGPYKLVPLRYLIGMLYVNFTMMWDPVIQLIKSHADGLDRMEFWGTWLPFLQSSASLAEKELHKEQGVRKPSAENEQPTDLEALYCQQQELMSLRVKDRADHVNFRHLLWKSMAQFPDKCEPRSRDLAPMLFSFLKNEFYPEDLDTAPYQDLERKSESMETDQSETLDQTGQSDSILQADGEDTDVANQKDHTKEDKYSMKRRRATSKSLVIHLGVFAKFSNPKNIYMEPQLTDLYNELLLHRDHDVQRVAYDCIWAYKHKYLRPYKANFERLLDDKTFKDEIVLFSIDSETGVVDAKHRDNLLPLLMRLLYGKMYTKTGNDTQGKAQAGVRRGIIFRFLAGCKQHELKVFVDLIFKPFKHLIESDDINKTVCDILQNDNISKVIPLRRQQSVLGTLEVIFNKLGHLLDSYLPSILRIMLGVAADCTRILERRERVNPKAINTLKTLRHLTIDRINQYFSHFDSYPFSANEISAVFHAVVLDQLKHLPIEGVHSPTPLLKVFRMWSQNPRYFTLFSKLKEDSDDISPLPNILALLASPHVRPNVVTMVMEIVENLLTTRDEDLQEGEVMLHVEHCVQVKDLEKSFEEAPSYGVKLLFPHVPLVFAHLSRVVAKMAEKRTGKQTVPAKELAILSRLSIFVTEPEQSAVVIGLLIPFLAANVSLNQETGLSILKTVCNLIRLVHNPGQFIRPICRLFSAIDDRMARNALCDVIRVIGDKNESLKKLADLLCKLNSWDKRRMEEPDYNQRLDAFREINSIIANMKMVDENMVLALYHNCCHVISKMNDMSLRESATYCITELTKRLAGLEMTQDTQRLLIVETLVPLVKSGMRLKTEVQRHEFISVLNVLIKHYTTPAVFQDLDQLSDPDPEADFFENIKHIQVHRRAKALRKLVRYLGTKSLKTESLTSYLLPLVTSFLGEEYLKQTNLIDATIDTIGAISKRLPWPHYLLLLRQHLGSLTKVSLTNQKVTVRLLVAILDSFHFDLSASKGLYDSHPIKKKTATKDSDNKNDDTKLDEMEEDATIETDTDPVAMETAEDEKVTESEDTECKIEKVKCPSGLATRIHRMIVKITLPQLHKVLVKKAKTDGEHKMSGGSKYAEDEEILRVPIALAMVKLMQHLPKASLENNLPGVILKVCQFLKSRAKDIRVSARDTLIKIMESVGPRYLGYVLHEMRGTLTRGYQLHVLCFTVNSLLHSLTSVVSPGDFDSCLGPLVKVFNEELFGEVAEEKEVAGITGKLFEAKTSKSYDSYEIIARFVGAESLGQLILPLKEILESSMSHKNTKKLIEVLRRVSIGLVENTGLTIEKMLIFSHGLTQDALPIITEKQKSKGNAKPAADPRFKPTNTYIVQALPTRGGVKPPTNTTTNAHILVEFALQLLHLLLKRAKLLSTNVEHLQLLDPFVPILADCLHSKHVKTASTALRCLSWVAKFPLPAMKDHIERVTNGMFLILHNYTFAGSAHGDNAELIVVCFKALTIVVRDIKYHSITEKQLHVLLGYIEEDIRDHQRQATAFGLLKAVLARKLQVPEMKEVISKVQELSVQSDFSHIRLQCRQVALQYLLDYPLGKELKYHLDFYMAQMNYRHEAGRESILEMLATIFSSFPQQLITQYGGYFFVPMVTRMINDDSAKCRKLVSLAIKSLLDKLESNTRDELFSLVVVWLKDDKVMHRRLGCVACGLFVEVESGGFERHLENILPIMQSQIDPTRFANIDTCSEAEQRDLDHLLFSVLNTISKILQQLPHIITEPRWTELLNHIWESLESHILYAHTWVRLRTAQLYGMLFSAYSIDDVVAMAKPKNSKVAKVTPGKNKMKMTQEYLEMDTVGKLRSLSRDFCSQLTTENLESDLAEQIVKNLVFLAKVIIKLVPPSEKTDNVKDIDDVTKENGSDATKATLNIHWLIRRLNREAKFEAATDQKSTLKRSSVFKWTAAVGLELGSIHLPPCLHLMLPALQREVGDNSTTSDADLKSLANEVLELFKGIVGVEVFTQAYANVQKDRSLKKEERKRHQAMEVIAKPEIAARKKIRKNEQKKEARKRKIDEFKPNKKLKKKRTT
ncbi:unnamed protein product [Owenia fusiformis]|uniref:Uncharacterized protein n=1 Tax=Owenia fusiformis TaxID=6347 RepID=A0A8J1XJ75_OWEFU|nr:unnamed protein product [Owenia fusiformis]